MPSWNRGVIPAILAVTFWVIGQFYNPSIVDLEYNRSIFLSIFFAQNYMFLLSFFLTIVLLFMAILSKNKKTWLLAIPLILLVLGETPYTIGLGRSWDSYWQMAFALYINENGHMLQSLEYISSWPGLHIFIAAFLSITRINPVMIIKFYPLLNLSLFYLGVFLMTKSVFNDDEKSLYSILFIFLGTNMIFYDLQMNWGTFSLVPLYITTFLSRDRRKQLLSVILFSLITISHAFNALLTLLILILMSRIRYSTLRSHRLTILCHMVIYSTWTSFIGAYFVKELAEVFIKAFTYEAVSVIHETTSYILIPHTIPQVFNRIRLGMLVASTFLALLVKRWRRIHFVFSLPTCILLGTAYFTSVLFGGPGEWFSFKLICWAHLTGFPVMASLLKELTAKKVSIHFRPKLVKNEKKLLVFLVCLTMLGGYLLSSYENQRYFTVSLMDIESSNFIKPLLQEKNSVNVLWVGSLLSLYFVSAEEMTKINPVSHLESRYEDIAIIHERWFSKPYTPDIPLLAEEAITIMKYITIYYNKIYSNDRVELYAPRITSSLSQE